MYFFCVIRSLIKNDVETGGFTSGNESQNENTEKQSQKESILSDESSDVEEGTVFDSKCKK